VVELLGAFGDETQGAAAAVGEDLHEAEKERRQEQADRQEDGGLAPPGGPGHDALDVDRPRAVSLDIEASGRDLAVRNWPRRGHQGRFGSDVLEEDLGPRAGHRGRQAQQPGRVEGAEDPAGEGGPAPGRRGRGQPAGVDRGGDDDLGADDRRDDELGAGHGVADGEGAPRGADAQVGGVCERGREGGRQGLEAQQAVTGSGRERSHVVAGGGHARRGVGQEGGLERLQPRRPHVLVVGVADTPRVALRRSDRLDGQRETGVIEPQARLYPGLLRGHEIGVPAQAGTDRDGQVGGTAGEGRPCLVLQFGMPLPGTDHRGGRPDHDEQRHPGPPPPITARPQPTSPAVRRCGGC
jgi:hypothetical protein